MECVWFIRIFGLLAIPLTSSASEPVVELPFGRVRGVMEDGFYSFRNIPYAEPPLDVLRFKPPKPATAKWNGELDATGPIKACTQFCPFAMYPGDEDCLYLHISTPDITCNEKFPVRIHIHGGAFMMGSADDVDASILAKRGMIVVTMGYRLGPLGFLSTACELVPGNNGIKDQRLAMKWVKENIKHFCGDPNKIVLAGTSAGGSSAHLLMLSKSTENYVNAIMAHNGAGINPWTLDAQPKKTLLKFLDQIGCEANPKTLMACLQGKTIDELRKGTVALRYYKGNPFTVFAPVVEPEGTDDPILAEHPEEIMKKGKAANVTLLVAYTEREGTANAASFLRLNEDGKPDIGVLNNRWLELAPIMLFFQNSKTPEEQVDYAISLKMKYMGDKEFSEANYRMLEDMYTETLFTDGIKKTIELHRKHNPGKVYAYLYKYSHNVTMGNLISGRMDVSFGADHMADTILTIPVKPLKPAMLTEGEMKLSNMLIRIYMDLANTGTLSLGGMDVPPKEGRLVFNQNCFAFENDNGESPQGCHDYE